MFGEKRTRLAAGLLLLAALAVACSSGGDEAAEGGADAAAMEIPRRAADSGGGSLSLDGGSAASDADDSAARDAYLSSALPERVIKTADLSLEVEDGRLGRALREGRAIAEGAGGFVLSTSVDGRERRRGDLTIRVPAEAFETTLSELEALGTVTGEDVRGQDVSQEFVDLEARLRNATAQEEVLFRLYDRSESIADTIRVQRELEDVQLEIERLRGRLRFLRDRTDLSTISVSVTEAGAVTAAAGPFEKAWDNARGTFVAVVSGAIVGAGFVLPVAALAVLAYAAFRLLRPRLQPYLQRPE
jgi:hypothetical protein